MFGWRNMACLLGGVLLFARSGVIQRQWAALSMRDSLGAYLLQLLYVQMLETLLGVAFCAGVSYGLLALAGRIAGKAGQVRARNVALLGLPLVALVGMTRAASALTGQVCLVPVHSPTPPALARIRAYGRLWDGPTGRLLNPDGTAETNLDGQWLLRHGRPVWVASTPGQAGGLTDGGFDREGASPLPAP